MSQCYCCDSRVKLRLDKKTGRHYCHECTTVIMETIADDDQVPSDGGFHQHVFGHTGGTDEELSDVSFQEG